MDETTSTPAPTDPSTPPPSTPGSSVNVSTPPPAPMETQASPQSTQQVQPQAPDQTQDPTAAAGGYQPPHDNLAVKVYHGIMGALGGTQDTSYARDPKTGQMIVTTTPSGPGSQWKRIIAGAVQGTAAGLGVGPGPGGVERAAGAGIQAGMQGAQQQDAMKRQQADQDYDIQQKKIVSKAQTQMLTYQGSLAAFQLSRAKVEAKAQDTERENNFMRLIQNGGNGSQVLGVAPDFNGILQMHKDMPNLLKENAQGNIVQVPHINADGEFAGTRYALVTPQWKDAKVDSDQTFYYLKPPTEVGEQPTIATQTVKAGTITNGDFINRQTAAGNEILKWQTENHKEAHQDKVDASTVRKNNAEANKANAEAEVASTPQDSATMQDTAEGLASGRYLLKDIPKRTTKGQPTPQQQMAAANQVSMQKYGLPYSPTVIAQENTFASAPKTQAYLEGVDRMVGDGSTTGQLQQILTLAQRAGLGNNAQWNDIKQAVKTRLGNTAAKNFDTLLTETQSNLGTLIGNPLLGSGESDLKLRTAKDAFGANPTLENLKGQVATVSDVLNRSRADMAKRNRYIQQRYGQQLSPQQEAPPGAQNEVRDAKGVLIGHTVNNVYVPLAGK